MTGTCKAGYCIVRHQKIMYVTHLDKVHVCQRLQNF